MLNHGLKQKHLDTLRRVLLPFSEKIEKVGLFGSRATGLYSSNSDIDLVIYGLVDEKTVDRIFTLLKDSNLPFKTDIQAYDLIKSLLGIFPAACGVIWRNEQIYT